MLIYFRNDPQIIPKVDFADLDHLSQVQIDAIKRRGSLLIRNVVPQDEALEWKRLLREYAELNPTVDGSSVSAHFIISIH